MALPLFMVLTEPITTLTDYAIAMVAFVLAGSLGRISWHKQQISVGLWAIAFICVAVAAALGGTCHGFLRVLDSVWLIRFWTGMIYLLSLASLAMLLGSILGGVPVQQQRWLLLATVAKSLLIWVILSRMPLFEIAVIDYGTSLMMVLLLQLRSLLVGPSDSASWLVAGIVVSGLAIGILASRLIVSPLLNANDLYHLVQLVGLGLLYQGAKRLRDVAA